jgi:hypothetical protein
MVKQKINMVGGPIQHDICSSAGHTPKLVEWVKNNHTAPISIHIDNGITNFAVDSTKRNFAWLLESKTISPSIYQWCGNNIEYLTNNFEFIFTHDKELSLLSDKIKLVICNAKPWVTDVGIHKKTKLVSMIASTKIMCGEHLYRQEIAKKYQNKIELFGRGFNEISKKEIGLNDYCFSITMENGTYPMMYTEKISDCFATGTIPIYYGTKLIGDVFNINGIIMLDETFDIDTLSLELYHSKMDAIKENYEITINMPTVEDYIYENYIK